MNILLFISLLSSTLVYSLDDDLLKDIEKGIEYYICTRKNPYKKIMEDNMDEINKNITTKVIFHGRKANNMLKFVQDTTVEYLKYADYNVIQVNWGKFAFGPYPVVARKTELIGAAVARFLAKLHDKGILLPSNIHSIGHSMGAHICGHLGKEFFKIIGSKISRITGLDPAATLFDSDAHLTKEMIKNSPPENGPVQVYASLEATDANIVDVIHTDRCLVGVRGRLGIVDFYPNGGLHQPGCPLTCPVDNPSVSEDVLGICFECSHLLSSVYFTESINNQKFVSTKCNSWKDYTSGKCNNNVKILMGGGYEYSPEATGKFFLTPFNNSK